MTDTAQSYQVTITMDAGTVNALLAGKFRLYAFHAVQTTQGGGAPTLWISQDYGMTTLVVWKEQYQAYVYSTSNNGVVIITTSFATNIAPGQVMNITQNGGTVVDGGPPSAISICNQTSTEWTCGISVYAGSVATPVCALPLFGNFEDQIIPIPKVLLLFSSVPAQAGTVLTQVDGSPGIFIDFNGVTERDVTFDINNGWSWGNAAWATEIAPDTPLTPLLIE